MFRTVAITTWRKQGSRRTRDTFPAFDQFDFKFELHAPVRSKFASDSLLPCDVKSDLSERTTVQKTTQPSREPPAQAHSDP
jgi:hypothetical protein